MSRLKIQEINHRTEPVNNFLLPQRSDNNHSQNSGEEKNDDDRIDDGEPMDLDVAHAQVRVPARRPANVRRLPINRVAERDLKWGGWLGCSDGLARQFRTSLVSSVRRKRESDSGRLQVPSSPPKKSKWTARSTTWSLCSYLSSRGWNAVRRQKRRRGTRVRPPPLRLSGWTWDWWWGGCWGRRCHPRRTGPVYTRVHTKS